MTNSELIARMANLTNSKNNDFPPCQLACPILTDAREYIQFIAERKFEEAFSSIRELNPLPGVCGRICTHPCEAACKRGQVDEPLAIAALKRFTSDGPWAAKYKAALPEKSSEERVAIVGSGPAGLAAAHDLALLGYQVTIFEALPVLGGMLRVGVPAYRLPKEVLDKEIEAILSLGIEVKTGVRVGEDVTLADLFDQGYKAVFVAVGAHEDRKLEIDGEDALDGVVSAVSFLRQVNQEQDPKVGNKVAVIGGGNTAVDSARSALRLGAKEVHMVYRRSQEEMPAAKEEAEEAIHEGVQMAYLTSPVEILGEGGKVSALKCIRNELGEPDVGGRRSPTPVQESEFALDVDMVIAAIGQAPESSFLANEPELAENGNRIVAKDPNALATPLAGVFAGGDAVTGPATAIKAIAAGKRAAVSIDLYLRGETLPEAEPSTEGETEKLPAGVLEKTTTFPRCQIQALPLEQRLSGLDEVASVLIEEKSVREAHRCLHCGLGARLDQEKCISCGACVEACPLEIPSSGTDGKVTIDMFQCQACGVCAVECPVQAINVSLCPLGHIVSQVENALEQSQDADLLIVGLFTEYGNFTRNYLDALGRDFPQIIPVMVHGVERISVSDILRIFQRGADGVFMIGAPPERQKFPKAQPLVEKRIATTQEVLDLFGFGGDRLILYTMPQEGLVEGSWIDTMIEKIQALGPNPLRKEALAA